MRSVSSLWIGLGLNMRPTFSKNACLHKIRTAAGFLSQNIKSFVNVFFKPGNEKVFFHEQLPDLL